MKKILIVFFFTIAFAQIFPREFKGAEYRTKEAYTYGRFEVRYKAMQNDGMLASFFTYHECEGVEEWNEIDIEIMGRYTDNVQFNTITPGQINHVRAHYVKFNPSLDYHTYAFEWTPDYVSWFIDGNEVYRQQDEHIKTLNRPQKIMMNVWNPTYANWAGKWNPEVLPAFAYYDWVSYSSYTPGKGNSGTDKNFTNQWKDEFNSWDKSRWQKATHTFDGNNCDFVYDNASFNDGKLILCLTDSINTGFTDKAELTALWARLEYDKIILKFSKAIDKKSSEKIINYSIDGYIINSSALLKDDRTIILFLKDTSTYNINMKNQRLKNITLKYTNIKEKENLQKIVSSSLTVIKQKQLTLPVKINCGGKAFNDYNTDQEFNAVNEYGFMDGQAVSYPDSVSIKGSPDVQIFKSEMKGMVAYKVRLPEGYYNVKLMMCENTYSETGKRIFDVYVEGNQIEKNLDLFKVSGKNNVYEKLIKKVFVNDGILDIHFSAIKEMAVINGIVIEKSEL